MNSPHHKHELHPARPGASGGSKVRSLLNQLEMQAVRTLGKTLGHTAKPEKDITKVKGRWDT